MKLKIAVVSLGLLAFSVAVVAAQDDATKTTHKKVRTLSGCLQKGDDAKEYKLTTAKGGTWEIKSDGVALSEHVGHFDRGGVRRHDARPEFGIGLDQIGEWGAHGASYWLRGSRRRKSCRLDKFI